MPAHALGYGQNRPGSVQNSPLAPLSDRGHASVVVSTGQAVPASPKPLQTKLPPVHTHTAFAVNVVHGAR